MATLRDGLGGEELAESGLQTGATNISPYFTGSITAESDITSATQLSGLNIFAQGSVQAPVMRDTDGELNSAIISQAANVYGMTIIAGSLLTGDSNVGVADFQAADFANANYMFVATARQYTIPGASGLNIGASGTRRASGLTVLGPSGTVFDWIAVGQRA